MVALAPSPTPPPAAVGRAAPASVDRIAATIRRFSPAEGWSTVLLHAIVLLAAAGTVELTKLAPPRPDLVLLTIGGLTVGLVMAKARVPDGLAHLLALASGLALSAWLGAARVTALPGNEWDRLRWLGGEALEWYRRVLSGQPIEGVELFGVVLGLTVWLVAYTSAWVLYRRGWLATALLLPGIVAFVNLGSASGASPAPLLLLVAAGCALAARYHGYRRQTTWRRAGLAHPRRLPVRFLWAGLNLALVVAILGWTVPVSAREGLSAAWQRLEAPWSQVQERWDELIGRIAGQTEAEGGSYASFGDAFQLGGALNLSDEPVMVYRPSAGNPGPTYLVGHRYDGYDGRGWRTRVEDTFQERGSDGGRYSPQMTFARGQGVHLTPSVLGDRTEARGVVEVIRPKGDLLFSRDTYLTSDVRTNVQLSWRQLDGTRFDLAGGNLSAVPVDLRQIALTLQQGVYDPTAASPAPPPLDPDLAAEVQAQAEALRQRFLDVTWTVAPNGRIGELVVTGQVPVYDDVEAVFADAPVEAGAQYETVGLASTATADALRGAGTDYPAWVAARYLDLPETVTTRTRELAAQLAADQPTPFDVARAVETFVRGQIAYNEDISPPPPDQDVVDYVLFASRQGYCVYYASAMAVLLRAQGIPARVAAGYYAVPWDAEQNGYLYREKNAHLWVEVYFPGYGWIPFEPTASREPLQYGPQGTPPPTPTPAPAMAPTPEPAAATPAPPAAAAPPPAFPPSLPDGLGLPGRVLALVVLGLAGLLATAAVLAAAVWQWRLRGLSPASGLWARALRAGAAWGIRADPAQTPAEYAAALGRMVPAIGAPARTVADLYTQEAYAGRQPAPPALRAARAAWVQLRAAMVGAALRRRRGRR